MTDAVSTTDARPPAACVLCGASTRQVCAGLFDPRFGVPGRYEIRACTACGIEQTHPRLSQQELQRTYERYYNLQALPRGRYEAYRTAFYASRLYRAWTLIDGDVAFHTVRGSGALLDVGCNEGRGLRMFKANGYAPEGVEINAAAAATARAAGFRVHAALPAPSTSSSRYRVAVLSNVLEHSLDPARLLDGLHGLLAEGGELWVSCPNARSWARSLFGAHWINWHVPFHIVHFSRDALVDLLRARGYEVFSARCVTPALWLAQSCVARCTAREGVPNANMRRSLLIAGLMLAFRGLGFPLIWLANRLGRGDCLVVRARKAAQSAGT